MADQGVMQRCCWMSCINRSALLPSARAPDRFWFSENMHAVHELVCPFEPNPVSREVPVTPSRRVLFASGGRQCVKRSRSTCQGWATLAQVKCSGTGSVQEYFPYRHAAILVLEKEQLLLHCDLSHVVIWPTVSETANGFSGTSCADIGHC